MTEKVRTRILALAGVAMLSPVAAFASPLTSTMTAVDTTPNAVETWGSSGKFGGSALQPTNEVDVAPPITTAIDFVTSSTGATLEAWVDVPSAPPSTVQLYVSAAGVGFDYTVQNVLLSGTTTGIVEATSPIAAGSHHVAAAIALSASTPPVFYVDGSLVPISGYLGVPSGTGIRAYGQLPAGPTIVSQSYAPPSAAFSLGALSDPSPCSVPLTSPAWSTRSHCGAALTTRPTSHRRARPTRARRPGCSACST